MRVASSSPLGRSWPTIGAFPGAPAAAFGFVVGGAVAADNGGYRPESWAWLAAGTLLVAALIVLFADQVRLGGLDLLFLGLLLALEDVTSETFERALRYRESYDQRRGPPAAWLVGIARRCIDDSFRRNAHELLVSSRSTSRAAVTKRPTPRCDSTCSRQSSGSPTATGSSSRCASGPTFAHARSRSSSTSARTRSK